MSALLKNLTLTMLLALAGCSSLPYQPAQRDSGESGYRDQEIAPGVFVIEVRDRSKLRLQLEREESLNTLTRHWQRRAGELCRFGYRGTPEVITSAEARLREFQCGLPECQQPLVSGVVWCHQRYEL